MSQPAARVPYRATPTGICRHTWINKPDTKYKEDGEYKTELCFEGKEAAALKAEIDAAANAAFELETEQVPAKDKKKWSVYVPYEEEEDDKGNKTGRLWVTFRQNAVILVEGERKEIKIAVYDANDKPTHAQVFSGSTLRVMYKPRSIKVVSSKQAGVRLDFLKVQAIKLADRQQGDGGFGSVEGGYVDDHAEETGDHFTQASKGGAAPSGDF